MRYRIEILPILQIYIGNIIRIACIYRTTYHIHILFPSLNPCIRQTDIDEIIPTSPSTVVNNDILTSKTYTQPVLVQNQTICTANRDGLPYVKYDIANYTICCTFQDNSMCMIIFKRDSTNFKPVYVCHNNSVVAPSSFLILARFACVATVRILKSRAWVLR